MTNVPAHIVITTDGRWLNREDVANTIVWAKARLATATPWERKFLIKTIEQDTRLLAK